MHLLLFLVLTENLKTSFGFAIVFTLFVSPLFMLTICWVARFPLSHSRRIL